MSGWNQLRVWTFIDQRPEQKLKSDICCFPSNAQHITGQVDLESV